MRVPGTFSCAPEDCLTYGVASKCTCFDSRRHILSALCTTWGVDCVGYTTFPVLVRITYHLGTVTALDVSRGVDCSRCHCFGATGLGWANLGSVPLVEFAVSYGYDAPS